MRRYGTNSTSSRMEDLLGGASSSSSEAVYTDQEPLSPLSNEPRLQQQDRGNDIDMMDLANGDDTLFYDLCSLKQDKNHPVGPHSYTIDPFEAIGKDDIAKLTENVKVGASRAHSHAGRSIADESDYLNASSTHKEGSAFMIEPGEIHPNMESKDEEVQRLRLLAGKISNNWGNADFMAPALARRIRDFQFAQEKRRKKYGDERPWGILGVYDHLASIRIDVEWAEDAAQRRANGDPYYSWADFDENKKGPNNRPYFTYFLLFICSAMMIASIAVNQWSVEPFDINPMLGPSAETLILMGAKVSGRIVVEKEWWRLVASSLLHAGLLHYIVNMLALWFVGAAVETSHGWFSATLIFCLSALGGSVLSAIFLPQTISVGASGGIFGFIGACLADIIMNWRLLFCDIVTENGTKHRHAIVVVVLLFDIILNSIIGLSPYIDNYNHLGGMMYGFLCGLTTMNRLSVGFFGIEESFMTQTKHFFTRFFGVIVSAASIAITLVILFQGDATTTPCPGCTWLSCVPFPPWESADNKWWYCDDCNGVTADIVPQPTFHLLLHCPSGAAGEVPLDTDESKFDRERVQKKLPTFCRHYCPIFEADPNNSLEAN